MAVLIEGYSVVLNKAQVLQNEKAQMTLNSIEATMHPMAACTDASLLRIGFVDLAHATSFIAALEAAGLQHKVTENGVVFAKDIAMVTQYGEMDIACPWLTIQFTKLADNTIICFATMNSAEPIKGIGRPKGWNLNESILKKYHDLRMQYMEENFDLVGDEIMHDVYENKITKETVRLVKLTMKDAAEVPAE